MIARLQAYRPVNNRDKQVSRHCIDMKKKAVIVSGYFNPIHKGHLEYFNNAKAMADELFVIVNNDHQRALKGSKEFQGEEERMIIVSNIKAVRSCYSFCG